MLKGRDEVELAGTANYQCKHFIPCRIYFLQSFPPSFHTSTAIYNFHDLGRNSQRLHYVSLSCFSFFIHVLISVSHFSEVFMAPTEMTRYEIGEGKRVRYLSVSSIYFSLFDIFFHTLDPFLPSP